MKKYVKIVCLMVLFSIFLNTTRVVSISNLDNYRFFLRISELYDTESMMYWQEIIFDKKKIIDYINKNNKQEQYKIYLTKIKNNKLAREKKKYINKLNISIEERDLYKIKRYLKLILNIFKIEHNEIKKNFNIEF